MDTAKKNWNAPLRPERVCTEAERAKLEEPVAESDGFIEWLLELVESVPDEDLEGVPHDGAKNVDHYLYGSPKAE